MSGQLSGDVSGLAIAGAVWWSIATAFFVLTIIGGLLQPALCARRAKRGDQPAVSVVLPIKLLEPGFAFAQESTLQQNYPQFEVLAAATDPTSPAAEAMKSIFARHPQISTRLLHSTAKFAVSPKVDNLYAPFTEAAHDVIFMKDSNVTLEADALEEHLRQLGDGVGLVNAIPYAAGAGSFAAQIEESIMNGAQARVLMLVAALGFCPGNGKIMLFRRSDFFRAGGFSAIDHTVGEDNAIVKALAGIGLKTVFSHRLVRQELGRRAFRDVYQRQLRWAVIRRDDERLAFALEPISMAPFAMLAAAVSAPLLGLGALSGVAATFGLWLCLESLLSFAQGWRLSWASPAILLLREATLVAVWLHALTTSRVVWAKDTVDARAAARPSAVKEEG